MFSRKRIDNGNGRPQPHVDRARSKETAQKGKYDPFLWDLVLTCCQNSVQSVSAKPANSSRFSQLCHLRANPWEWNFRCDPVFQCCCPWEGCPSSHQRPGGSTACVRVRTDHMQDINWILLLTTPNDITVPAKPKTNRSRHWILFCILSSACSLPFPGPAPPQIGPLMVARRTRPSHCRPRTEGRALRLFSLAGCGERVLRPTGQSWPVPQRFGLNAAMPRLHMLHRVLRLGEK